MHQKILATSWLLILLLVLIRAEDGTTPSVNINGLGEVTGTTTESLTNSKTIYSFYSIPYGQTPKDELRFQMPQPSLPWNGSLDCSKSGPICPQPDKFFSPFTPNGEGATVPTSEDCLRLDVHTTNLNSSQKLPVFVFLHGGAFAIGGSYSIKPNFLLDYDMVLVVPQFRLGPLGFLSLDMEEIPGNAGLFDQKLALNWVQDHIEDFGGDRNKVTLGGQSTGAASAILHMLSPLSEGLFHRIIAHGGTGIAHWAINEDPVPSAINFAKTVNCNDETSEKIAACLQSKSTDDLVKAYKGEDGNFLSPVVQKSVKNKFIGESTFDLLTSATYKSVPIMAGCNKHEGLLYLEDLVKKKLEPGDLLHDSSFLKNELVGYISSLYAVPDSSGVLVDSLTKRFFNDGDLGDFNSMFDGLVDLCGSSFVKGHIYRLVQFNSESNLSFLYTFNYYSEDHIVKHADISPKKDGVIHGDEMVYLFPQENISLDEEQQGISAIMTELWANFITYGNPTPAAKSNSIPKWAAFTKENDIYLMIDKNATDVKSNFRTQLTASIDDGLVVGDE